MLPNHFTYTWYLQCNIILFHFRHPSQSETYAVIDDNMYAGEKTMNRK